MEKKCNPTSVVQTILLVILVFLSGFSVAFLMGWTPNFQKEASNTTSGFETQIREALLQHEYAKVGGKENYEIITALQQEILKNPMSGQDIETQKNILKQLQGGSIAQQPSDVVEMEHPTGETSFDILSEEKRTSILKNAVIEGSKDAEVIVVEYSDMECPYCVRQINDNEITKKLKEEFGDKVATVFKNHRGVNHKGTEKKALGAICANRVGGAEMYSKFYHEIFDYSKENEGYYPVSKLADIAKEIGLDVEKWNECLSNSDVLAQFEAETAEAVELGMRGTPGTLIFNTKTGKYTTVSGADRYARFKSEVESLLSK